MGGATDKKGLSWRGWKFQSTLPVGGATEVSNWHSLQNRFQSTLPVGGATDRNLRLFIVTGISIHAPRGGSDKHNAIRLHFLLISIHAPRGGSDCFNFQKRSRLCYFNPRSPWGERLGVMCGILLTAYFNPRSPWGERPARRHHGRKSEYISIHAPRGGSDEKLWTVCASLLRFQSTLPVGGATPEVYSVSFLATDFNPRSPWGERPDIIPIYCVGCHFNPRSPWGERLGSCSDRESQRIISIHAPRGGSDPRTRMYLLWSGYFNPRSPWGERPVQRRRLLWILVFQSTLPVGGATSYESGKFYRNGISIHAPRGGSDYHTRKGLSIMAKISIHAPRGGSDRTKYWLFQMAGTFQSTLPVGGATSKTASRQSVHHVFQSTLPVGGATSGKLSATSSEVYFNPRSPWGERQERYGFYG